MTKTKLAMFLLCPVMALSISCSPGLVDVDCDARSISSSGLGKVGCKLANLA